MLLRGRSISPGDAAGQAMVLNFDTALGEAREIPSVLTPNEELARFDAAVKRAGAQLELLRGQLSQRVSSEDAAIFRVQVSVLRDKALYEKVYEEIFQRSLSAESAVARAVTQVNDLFLSSKSLQLQDKASDVLDVGRRLLKCLRWEMSCTNVAGRIVVMPAATPSELVHFARQGVAALVTQTCGLKSHTAILARGLGVPMVSGLPDLLDQVRDGQELFVDATGGTVIVDPTTAEQPAQREILARIEQAGIAEVGPLPVVTRDGEPLTLLLNISDPLEAVRAARLGAAGVGLFRTEFLYIDRSDWPTSEESLASYREVAGALGHRELAIRLADFGAEKSPSYANIPVNRNPSLGIRGIRLLLQRDDILRPQLVALARLATEREITVLLPMVDTPETLATVQQRIRADLELPAEEPLPFKLGIMIEVPTAALVIEDLIDQIDCVAVGLNDLTQYLLAADRDDELVEAYHDALQPAVLRLVRRVLDLAAAHNKPVTMCGELAGNPLLTLALLTLGARRFSVSGSHYATAAEIVRQVDLSRLTSLAEKIVHCRTSREVRQLLRSQCALPPGLLPEPVSD